MIVVVGGVVFVIQLVSVIVGVVVVVVGVGVVATSLAADSGVDRRSADIRTAPAMAQC